MQYTIDIPDRLLETAMQGATRINGRRREAERQPEPLTFGESEARDIVVSWLTALVVQDAQERAQREMEAELQEKQREMQEYR